MTAVTPESKVKDKVKRLLKKHGVYWFMPVQIGYGARTLDFLCCLDGDFFAIETKAGNKQMTGPQEAVADAIRAAGGKVFLVNEKTGLGELEEWLILGK